MQQVPWTAVGSLQQGVRGLQAQLHRKADSYEVIAITGRVDRLERIIREIRTEVASLQRRMQELEAGRVV